MKSRLGMVPNSSSASFVVSKKKLNDVQKWLIVHHNECFHLIGHDDAVQYISKRKNGTYDTGWDIMETNDAILGGTMMDNFGMQSYFDLCGIKHKVKRD